MKISDIRVRRVKADGKIKGIASFVIDDAFAIHEVRIIEGEKGLFVAMPSKRDYEGEYRDICHPLTKEVRDEISSKLIEAYNQITD